MATHSSVLAWRIPDQGSLVGCRLWGRTESDMTEVTQQQQQQQQSAYSSYLIILWDEKGILIATKENNYTYRGNQQPFKT